MSATVEELAEQLHVDPDDIRALVAMYDPEEVDLWEEEGVLSDLVINDIDDAINPWCVRTVPQLFWPEAND